MEFIRNLPFIGIFLCMSTGVINSVLDGKWAKKVSFTVITANLVMSILVLYYAWQTKQSYIYVMGHHPAPWGNEIRFGILEGSFATFFCLIMLLSKRYTSSRLSLPSVTEPKMWRPLEAPISIAR